MLHFIRLYYHKYLHVLDENVKTLEDFINLSHIKH